MQFSLFYEAISSCSSLQFTKLYIMQFLQFMKLYIMQFCPIYKAIHHAVFSNLWSYIIMQFPPIYKAIHHAVFSNLWSYTSCSFLQFTELYILQFPLIYEAIHYAVFSNLWSFTSCSFLQFTKLYIMQYSPIYEAIHHAVFSNSPAHRLYVLGIHTIFQICLETTWEAARYNITVDERCTALRWEPLHFLLSDRNSIQNSLKHKTLVFTIQNGFIQKG